MSITYYSYPGDRDKVLSPHFKMGEFVSDSDYTDGDYPSSVPIHDKLPEVLESIYEHFGCTLGIINSGYRSPSCDISVGGSGGGPHTIGIAADVYFYRNGEPVPSYLIACFLQRIGIRGIGLNCGGNRYGTHVDMRGFGIWDDSVWLGDEAVRDASGNYKTVSDFFAYTGTSNEEVDAYSRASNTPISSVSTQKRANARTTSDTMINFIKQQEGLSLKACKAISSEAYWTIGYGHYGADVDANQTITEAEAEVLLRSDLRVFEDAVNSMVDTELTQSQFDACVSLAYNIGIGAFAGSDILAYINSGQPGHACCAHLLKKPL